MALVDPRFPALGRLMGRSRRDALGGFVDVWSHCTEKATDLVSGIILDAIFEHDGVGALIVAAGLAEVADAPANESGKGLYRIKGCEGRTNWLKEKRESGQRGGKASAARRSGVANPSKGQAEVKQVVEVCLPFASPKVEAKGNPLALAIAPALTEKTPLTPLKGGMPPLVLKLEPDPNQPQKRRRISREKSAEVRAQARTEAASFLEWFNRNFDRCFEGSDTVEDMVYTLLKKGHTQKDLRAVAWLLRGKWLDDPEMAPHLVPETILRPTKFGGRLDEAREKYRNGAA